MLTHVAMRIEQVQQTLGRRLVLENPSSYLAFQRSTMPEWEFLARLAEQTGCGLLLDVNNVYVSAFNHGFDAQRFVDAMPASAIAQIHLSGHRNFGTHIIDTHDDHVAQDVWQLYEYAIRTKGMIPTMIEWDAHIPAWEVLLAELATARCVAADALRLAA
jgi:uncharacterized protein (UPF0276 family)